MSYPNVLYSTVTWLAFQIAREYYEDVHYAWCAPIFDGRDRDPLAPSVPPTSSPFEIYSNLKEEISRGDRHSAKIQENKTGLLRGAAAKFSAKTIDAQEQTEIEGIVAAAGLQDFKPLILVIPYANVASLVQSVPLQMRASLFSTELIIPQLPRKLFDVIRP
jgi:hypothetical protein